MLLGKTIYTNLISYHGWVGHTGGADKFVIPANSESARVWSIRKVNTPIERRGCFSTPFILWFHGSGTILLPQL